MKITHEAGKYVLYKEKTVIGTAALEDGRLWVEIDPAWRQRGYGSYLVKEILQQNGGMTSNARPALPPALPLTKPPGPY